MLRSILNNQTKYFWMHKNCRIVVPNTIGLQDTPVKRNTHTCHVYVMLMSCLFHAAEEVQQRLMLEHCWAKHNAVVQMTTRKADAAILPLEVTDNTMVHSPTCGITMTDTQY
jgi:hypothetical protein